MTAPHARDDREHEQIGNERVDEQHSCPAERSLTIGVNDTLVGIPTALLVGAGAIIDLVGFAPIYLGIGALTLLGVVLAGRLPTAAYKAEAVS